MSGPSRTTDAAGLAAIHAAAFGAGWDAAAFAALLDSPGCLALGFPGRAFILLRVVLDEAEIITLATAPAHRRLGLAQALLEAGCACCAAAGAMTVHLEVAADNQAAGRLYCRLGFEPVGRRARYYADGGDARLLRLSLCAGPGARPPG